MATIIDENGNVIDLASLPDVPPIVLDDAPGESGAGAGADGDDGSVGAGQPDDGPAFTFDGDEGADADADTGGSTVIRTLREKTREQARRIKELEEATNANKPADIGPKPTLESCGYDEDVFEQAVIAYNGKKSEQARKAEEEAQTAREAQQKWANRVLAFEAKAKEMVPGFEDIAREVADHFGDDPAGVHAKTALLYADDPRLIAALKNSPAKLAELVALKSDPLALAIAVGELKGKIKTMPRRSAPPPETVTRGGAPVAASADKQLERLERDAERTGDRSAVIAYKREQKNKAA